MATGAVNPALLLKGPGILYSADIGTAFPANTVTASKFDTAAWTGWAPIGSTAEGSSFSDELSVDPINVAETVYPVAYVSTGREATWETALTEWNKTNLRVALNGGTQTVTGATTTTLTKISPPDVGQEVRKLMGWQSEDDTVRLFGYQVLNVGNLSAAFRKGADIATLTISWRFEKPPTGAPYDIFLAGAARGA